MPELTAADAVDLLRRLEHAGIEVWLDGGWAVDAALGEQTRRHKDLDIVLRMSDVERLTRLLDQLGFRLTDGGTPSNFVLADDAGREVDVHAVVFDDDGDGVYRMHDGTDWIFPAAGFTGRGTILGVGVRCLSPEVQVLCHASGYTPSEKDIRDMELLKARFGVELPTQLQRQPGAGSN